MDEYLNNVSIEDRACSNCNHSEICKYKEDFINTYNNIKDIGNKNNDFITVVIKCKHWIGKIINVR